MQKWFYQGIAELNVLGVRVVRSLGILCSGASFQAKQSTFENLVCSIHSRNHIPRKDSSFWYLYSSLISILAWLTIIVNIATWVKRVMERKAILHIRAFWLVGFSVLKIRNLSAIFA